MSDDPDESLGADELGGGAVAEGVPGDGGVPEGLRRWRLALGAGAAESAAAPGGTGGHKAGRKRRRQAAGAAAPGATDEGDPVPLGGDDARLDAALSVLYERPEDGRGSPFRVGHGPSAPKVSAWLGDIRTFFPSTVAQVVQKDAFERLGLKQLLLDPDFLATVEPSVHMAADLISLKHLMPDKAKATARIVVAKIVDDLMARLQHKTEQAIRGARMRARRTNRPRFADIDWPRTISKNLRHWQQEYRTIIPERLVGWPRQTRRAELDEVVLCVDQSGSMAASVVYASIFAAVLAGLPTLLTRLVCYDTTVIDLTDQLADPVDVLFGVQLGGGNDTPLALRYCEQKITRPSKTHLVLISDLYEGAGSAEMLERLGRFVASGVSLIVLLALNDDGRPSFDGENAKAIAAMGAPCFACTPDRFPDLMAAALKRDDLHAWAAAQDIALVRG